MPGAAAPVGVRLTAEDRIRLLELDLAEAKAEIESLQRRAGRRRPARPRARDRERLRQRAWDRGPFGARGLCSRPSPATWSGMRSTSSSRMRLGVRSDRDDILYPYSRPRGGTFVRRRVLATGITQQPSGEPLVPWFPAGRPAADWRRLAYRR